MGKGANIIPIDEVRTDDLFRKWAPHFAKSFPFVNIEADNLLAESEGLREGSINTLDVQNYEHAVWMYDRPTTIDELEEIEIEAIRDFIGRAPSQFIACEFRDTDFFRDVLEAIFQLEGDGKFVIENEWGELKPLNRVVTSISFL